MQQNMHTHMVWKKAQDDTVKHHIFTHFFHQSIIVCGKNLRAELKCDFSSQASDIFVLKFNSLRYVIKMNNSANRESQNQTWGNSWGSLKNHNSIHTQNGHSLSCEFVELGCEFECNS